MTINWSPQQKDIFAWFESGNGNLVVIARAGTGKTTSILEAINYAPEEKILLAAFNKKISNELTQKLRNPKAEAKTLHALGFAYIRRQWGNVRVDDDVNWERAQKACNNGPDVIVSIVAKLAAFGKNMVPFATVQDLVQIASDRDLLADPEWEDEGWTVEKIAGCALRAMELAAECADRRISFDDMVFVPVVNRFVRGWYNMVVVDEAQDMNFAQILLAQKACKAGGRIVVVGDPAQAIYGFRGADSGSIERLTKELNAKTLPLTITRRCPKRVVAIAQEYVADFEAAPEAPEGVIESCNKEQLYKLAKTGDFVLSRKNAPLATTCLKFLRLGVPARIEGRDIGAGLVAIVKKIKAKSVPDFLAKLAKWCERGIKRAKARNAKPAVEEGIVDQYEALVALAEGLTSVGEIQSRIVNLFQDSENNPKPAVVLSSIHRAKGLESENVFILAETLGRTDNPEERNIAYVACTRSKNRLVWVKESA